MTQNNKKTVGKLSFYLLTMFVLIIFFAVISCHAQTTYSDIWFDDSDVDSDRLYEEGEAVPGAYVFAYGASQDNYNTYSHSYWVYTTIHGPDGRTGSSTSSTSSSYAYAEVGLGWTYDESQVGDFTVDTVHYLNCSHSMYYGNPFSWHTFDLIRVGLSTACYQRGGSDGILDYFYLMCDSFLIEQISPLFLMTVFFMCD
jgi:hypothetical protein